MYICGLIYLRNLVGNSRVVDVLDVATQDGLNMSMKGKSLWSCSKHYIRSAEWVAYYNSKEKDRLLNVISLEFSHSALDKYVQAPTIVRTVLCC